MAVEHTGVRPSARRRRGIRGAAVLSAVAAGIAGAAVASSVPASAAPPPSDGYTVCLPTPCMPVANAVVTGTVAWTANANTFEAENARLPVVTVFFTEIDNGVALGTQTFRVLRGDRVTRTTRVLPTTDALRISLCPSASESPQANCASTVVERAR
jgi:hypothetical protein